MKKSIIKFEIPTQIKNKFVNQSVKENKKLINWIIETCLNKAEEKEKNESI